MINITCDDICSYRDGDKCKKPMMVEHDIFTGTCLDRAVLAPCWKCGSAPYLGKTGRVGCVSTGCDNAGNSFSLREWNKTAGGRG